MKGLLATLAGVFFGLGLGISGMTQPSKVVGFLDVGGSWDPSLACVMIGAIAVHFFGIRLARGRGAPLFGNGFAWPKSAEVDRPLVVGAAIFGVGWGLGGFCPGPALVGAASGSTGAIAFTGAMVLGMLAHRGRQS